MFADHPKILERFAVRYGKYLKDNRTALDAAIIDPTGLVARHCLRNCVNGYRI